MPGASCCTSREPVELLADPGRHLLESRPARPRRYEELVLVPVLRVGPLPPYDLPGVSRPSLAIRAYNDRLTGAEGTFRPLSNCVTGIVPGSTTPEILDLTLFPGTATALPGTAPALPDTAAVSLTLP